jgi:hypothetical protein
VFARQLVVGDVAVILPTTTTVTFSAGASLRPGFAAAARDNAKQRAYYLVFSVLSF